MSESLLLLRRLRGQAAAACSVAASAARRAQLARVRQGLQRANGIGIAVLALPLKTSTNNLTSTLCCGGFPEASFTSVKYPCTNLRDQETGSICVDT